MMSSLILQIRLSCVYHLSWTPDAAIVSVWTFWIKAEARKKKTAVIVHHICRKALHIHRSHNEGTEVQSKEYHFGTMIVILFQNKSVRYEYCASLSRIQSFVAEGLIAVWSVKLDITMKIKVKTIDPISHHPFIKMMQTFASPRCDVQRTNYILAISSSLALYFHPRLFLSYYQCFVYRRHYIQEQDEIDEDW